MNQGNTIDNAGNAWSGIGMREREYALVCMERSHTSGGPGNISVMRILTTEEAHDIFYSILCEEDEDSRRIATAERFISHCNEQTSPRSVLVGQQKGPDTMTPGSKEYEVVTPEMPVRQEQTYNVAQLVMCTYLAEGVDPSKITEVRQITEVRKVK